LDWTVQFESPDSQDPDDVNVYADRGYENYYTNSVGDWLEGKALSLKVSAGGNLVPFSNAPIGHIFKLSSGATLKAFANATETTPSVVITHAALVRNYYRKAFAVFDSEEKAKAYHQGDDTKVLVFYKPGGAITPANPAWEPIAVASSLTQDPTEQGLEYTVADQELRDRALRASEVSDVISEATVRLYSRVQSIEGTVEGLLQAMDKLVASQVKTEEAIKRLASSNGKVVTQTTETANRIGTTNTKLQEMGEMVRNKLLPGVAAISQSTTIAASAASSVASCIGTDVSLTKFVRVKDTWVKRSRSSSSEFEEVDLDREEEALLAAPSPIG
jgi:hypothetical protein